MASQIQDAVCAFVREIMSVRTGETIELKERPERLRRNIPAVEELWQSPTRRYAIEHTRLESFDGQIANEARLQRLITPVREALAGRLPGSHVLAVRVCETQTARIKYADAHSEILRLTLDAAPTLKDGETVILPSTRLPFSVQLHRRNGRGSHVAVHTLIEGDADLLRLDRMRRALHDKCPKLARWATAARTSVLVLEADDIQLSNVSAAYEAFEQALAERTDRPDVVVFVETDGSPMYGWMFKDGEALGDDVWMPDWHRSYTEGQIRRS
jgi:hypothetical protein